MSNTQANQSTPEPLQDEPASVEFGHSKERPDHCPEDVPRWYLYQQNRAVQREQFVTQALLFTLWAPIGLAIGDTVGVLMAAIGVLGACLAILKNEAAEKGSLAERIAERLNIVTWHYPQEYTNGDNN